MQTAEDDGVVRRSLQDVLGPQIYGLALIAMNVAFAAAVLAGGYLLYGILSGNLSDYAHLPHADQLRVLSNIGLASHVLTYGMAIGAMIATGVLWGEDYAGYGMVGATLLVGVGVPFLQGAIGVHGSNAALQQAQAAFPSAMPVPLTIGGLLVAYDIVQRLIHGFRDKSVEADSMTFGQGAAKKATSDMPARTSLIGKCWEGPYCREFVRPRCPIFLSRSACWRIKKGCYCEADIVSAAADQVHGIHLEMAPDPAHNFANPPVGEPPKPKVAFDPLADPSVRLGTIGVGGRADAGVPTLGGGSAGLTLSAQHPPRKIELTMAQKRERCRNCVIYNEHEREKYRVLLPATMAASIGFCVLVNVPLRAFIGTCLKTVDTLVNQASFSAHNRPMVIVGQASDAVVWCLFAALALIVVTKALQTLEWAMFKAKI